MTPGGEGLQSASEGLSFEAATGTLKHCLEEKADVVVAKEWAIVPRLGFEPRSEAKPLRQRLGIYQTGHGTNWQ